jgi:MFS family permease
LWLPALGLPSPTFRDSIRPEDAMPFQPSESLKSRTFLGLIVAQFLAGFNDQAIHAASMFYAIHHNTLTDAQAISLMPILFYAPWAIFCTLAGYLADRFSKQKAVVIWKVAEVGITLLALGGFYLGTVHKDPLGPWIVLSTVFLMGTHAAFFAPAKYGAMPEILQPQVLSRGNGILESTTFLAAILGTVSGGLLSFVFKDQEYFIGLILVGLAVIGAVASFLVARLPAANPNRPFPANLFKPLLDNLRIMRRSRPLALSVLGIAFFIFMVAFMRSTMYMHGESRIPRWTEFKTSLVVAAVALGAGLGSPLVGYLSGGKVELGLVPFGAVGMILATLVAAFTLDSLPALVVCLVFIGFFAGFYLVPMYTLLQHRAPKTSKGDLVATSNFINVLGAMAASALFFSLVSLAHFLGVAPEVRQVDGVAQGQLIALVKDDRNRPRYVLIQGEKLWKIKASRETGDPGGGLYVKDERGKHRGIKASRDRGNGSDIFDPLDQLDIFGPDEAQEDIRHNHFEIETLGSLEKGDQVVVSRYEIHQVFTYRIRPAGEALKPAYNNEALPRLLFIGASLMTLGILILLCRQLPDFFLRALLWLRAQRRYRLKVVGMNNLPSNGPVILATNCDRLEKCLQVITATDRFTRFVLLEGNGGEQPSGLLRYLAQRTGLVTLHPQTDPPEVWDKALAKGAKALGQGNLLGLTADGQVPPAGVGKFIQELQALTPAPMVPVYCGSLDAEAGANTQPGIRRVQVVIGQALPSEATIEVIQRTIHLLGEWVRQTEAAGEAPATARIPTAASASPTETASGRPGYP